MEIVVKLPNCKHEDRFEIEDDYWHCIVYLSKILALIPFTEIKFFSTEHSQLEERFIEEYEAFSKSRKNLIHLVSFFSFQFSFSADHNPVDVYMYFDSDEVVEIHVPLMKSEDADDLIASMTEDMSFECHNDDEDYDEDEDNDDPVDPFEYFFVKDKIIIRTLSLDNAELIIFFLLRQDYASNQIRFLHKPSVSN